MVRRRISTRQTLKQLGVSVAVIIVTLWSTSALLHADSNQLVNRSLTLGNASGGITTYYKFSFQPVNLDTLETIELQICSNTPFPGTPCTAPVGFDASNAVLTSQSGDTGFSILPSQSTANMIVLARPPLASNAAQDTYVFSGVVNPSAFGSYYVRVETFDGNDLTAVPTNYGGIAYAINSSVSVNATVPPYLLFCAGVTINGYNCDDVEGNYVNFGEFSSALPSQGDTQMLAATNAKDGYAIRVAGTTLTSGNNVIPNLGTADVSRAGTSQFGLNLRANSSPSGGLDVTGPGTGLPASGYNQINFYRFNSGDVVASSNGPDDDRKYTATYLINVNKNQSPGVYVATLTYIALGSF